MLYNEIKASFESSNALAAGEAFYALYCEVTNIESPTKLFRETSALCTFFCEQYEANDNEKFEEQNTVLRCFEYLIFISDNAEDEELTNDKLSHCLLVQAANYSYFLDMSSFNSIPALATNSWTRLMTESLLMAMTLDSENLLRGSDSFEECHATILAKTTAVVGQLVKGLEQFAGKKSITFQDNQNIKMLKSLVDILFPKQAFVRGLLADAESGLANDPVLLSIKKLHNRCDAVGNVKQPLRAQQSSGRIDPTTKSVVDEPGTIYRPV